MSARALFWGSAATAGWVLAGYPLSLLLLPRRPWTQSADALPSLTVLVPAYREREALATKLAALVAGDYPRDRLQVLALVDEDEATAAAARAIDGVEVLFAASRGGKAVALNRGLAQATGDVVVLTDANNVLAPGALRAAARHFADPAVWGVAGRRGEVASAYDRYEDALRRLETRSGACAAASGELFAVRRERLPSFDGDVINDDLWLLCRLVRDGGRVVYEPAAASVEDALGARAEVARRSRIGAGRVALAGELRTLPPGFVVRLVSHKFGRLVLPFALLGALLGSAGARWRRVFGLQAGAYALGGLAAAGVAPPGKAGWPLRALGQFVLGNVAVAAGVVRGLRGRQDVRWEPVR